ncbi:beta-glucosidase BglX [Meridianimaribacter sp. CL38]|uniref:beta-glucosidase BglX n=1 Tax=Meridianimaribacter sp. CL38 TaxID=2213021 RepID=UPI00103F5881|nr:beta-glucosidase BglX [Meridianimaribacter sp. CL38]TBV27841.1 beta-glucosidase BglX [Meridianimaribacter sp. CL38]
MKTIKITRVCAVAVILLCLVNTKTHAQMEETKVDINQKVESLLSQMTIEEKVGQMNLYNGFWDVTGPAPEEGNAALKYDHLKKGWVGAMLTVRGAEEVRNVQRIAVEESRLGIPLLIGFDVIHGYKTLSPIPLAESASWDLQAIEKSARVAATEASASGINWTFAPMVDISRDARWGRVMEGAGEDPYLGSLIAKARVNGFQGDDLSAHNTIAACAKHFAAYGFAEAGRDYNVADIGNGTLYNTVLPPFKAASEAGVKTFMNSFNTLNGVPVTGSSFLQRDILKRDWNFDGFVVSDWASINEMIPWGHAKDKRQAAQIAANAGSDMDMEGYVYIQELAQLVKDGVVKESILDDAVRRILKVKFELGLFEDPYRYCDDDREKEWTYHESYREAVLDMAKKSIVLLKNDNNLLPLKKNGQTIALIGDLADDKSSPLGSWRIASDDDTAVSVLEGMSSYKGNTLNFSRGPEVFEGTSTFLQEVKINTNDTSGFDEAIATAKAADVVVMVLGEHGFQSGEGRSRTNLDLPGLQQELLEEVYKVNTNVVLVLNNGRPLAIEWASEHIPAIVEAWHLGTESGNAIANVLYGDYNPSGKLPMSFPRNVGQAPIYYNNYPTGRPTDKDGNVFWSHYTDVEKTPLYPFGHGLSYTTFEYSNLKVTNTYKENQEVKVSFTLKNTGALKGKEVAQLYIRDLVGSVIRPLKELKGFELIELEAGASKTVEFVLTKKELGFYTNQGEFVVESGDFKVFVGGDSNAELEQGFTLE